MCYNVFTDLSGQNIPLLLLFEVSMNVDFEKIRKAIEPAMQEMNIEITDISNRYEGKYHFLTIELDKVNGIDLDTIVEATNVINPIIDKLDIIDDSYILDIVSKERGN